MVNSTQGRFTPPERAPLPSGPRGRSGQVRRISLLTGFEAQTVQIAASRYTAHVIKAPRWLPIRTEKESDKPMHLQALCHAFYLNTFQLAYPAAWVAVSHWTSIRHITTLLTESQAFLKSINSGWTSPVYYHFITHNYLSWFQASAAV